VGTAEQAGKVLTLLLKPLRDLRSHPGIIARPVLFLPPRNAPSRSAAVPPDNVVSGRGFPFRQTLPSL